MTFREIENGFKDQLTECNVNETFYLLHHTARQSNHKHLNFVQTEELLDLFMKVWKEIKKGHPTG